MDVDVDPSEYFWWAFLLLQRSSSCRISLKRWSLFAGGAKGETSPAISSERVRKRFLLELFILSYLLTSYLIKDTRGYHNQPTWISNPSTCHDVTITSLKPRSLEQPRPTTSWHLTSLTSSSFTDSAIRHSFHQFPLVSTITSWHSSRPQESLYGKVTSRH